MYTYQHVSVASSELQILTRIAVTWEGVATRHALHTTEQGYIFNQGNGFQYWLVINMPEVGLASAKHRMRLFQWVRKLPQWNWRSGETTKAQPVQREHMTNRLWLVATTGKGNVHGMWQKEKQWKCKYCQYFDSLSLGIYVSNSPCGVC